MFASASSLVGSTCGTTARVVRALGAPARSLRASAAKPAARASLGTLWAAARRTGTVASAAAEGSAPYTHYEQVPESERIPVTIITGFLGSGKTTLLNRILTGDHGRRIAVIENEYGEIDIDSDLVATQEYLDSGGEVLVQMNNGCLCCSIRDDLVGVLHDLYDTRRQDFDHIVIETTGLANPNPIIQSFYLDPLLPEKLSLDGIITVVDSKHVTMHLDTELPDGVPNECVEQIAYADRVVLNKVDLLGDARAAETAALEARIRAINRLVEIRQAERADVPIDYVLGMAGFDIAKIEEQLEAEEARRTGQSAHDHAHDHDHDCAGEGCTHESHAHAHDHDHDHDCAGEGCTHESHAHDHSHAPAHDDRVSSVSLRIDGELDLNKVNIWLDALLELRKEEMYRMKGVLAIAGQEKRYVFQGVHMLFEGLPDREWREDEPRVSKMVFIGRDLEEQILRDGFEACLVEEGAEKPVEEPAPLA